MTEAIDAIVQIGSKCYTVGPNGRREIEGAATLNPPPSAFSAVDRAREVARQVAERQKEIGCSPNSTSSATYEQLLDTFTLDQRELRQLLAVKLRALAASVEGINSTRPATAGEIQREVARLGDIAGVLK